MNFKAKSFFASEMISWDLARENYANLQFVERKVVDFERFNVEVHFNPSRIFSAAADVDENSIAARKCFLCAQNRPKAQQAVDCGHFELLVNPYPIFPEHFTIASKQHEIQQIKGYFADFLYFAHELNDFVVFFNAADCGASAPDHLHFQAGTKNYLPLIKDYNNLKISILQNNNFEIFTIKNYLRTVFCVEAASPQDAETGFNFLYGKISTAPLESARINLLAFFEDGKYYVFVFPRRAFRPRQYFAENERERLIISPGTVEMSGILITPVKSHFDKITAADIADIYGQVSAALVKF